jgi:hypothetical protein
VFADHLSIARSDLREKAGQVLGLTSIRVRLTRGSAWTDGRFGGYRLAHMSSLISLQPDTFSRLVEEARRRHETVDAAADRILREHLPVIRDTNSTLATLGRLKQLRARMKPGKGAVRVVHEGRRELERRQP